MAAESEVQIKGLKRPLVEDYSDEEEEEEYVHKDEYVNKSRQCPYLDTINRQFLDFDFEKLCSISLSHTNVYACLVCGKYFQGRGKHSHAYTHSVQVSHHVFLNLHTLKFYCLPDNYEVIDSSLDDIKYVLNPTFQKSEVDQLDKTNKLSRAFDGTTYRPGVVGLNNIKENDYLNVVLQAMSFVPTIRDFFLHEENYKDIKMPSGDISLILAQRFGELLRKLWNPRNFKAHVSPHEMLQAVVLCSKKKFQFTEQGDPVEFLSWFLNALHSILRRGTKSGKSSNIKKIFQGKMRITSRKLPPTEDDEAAKKDVQNPDSDEYKESVTESPFWYLSLDTPAAPLFKDEMQQNIIPQVSIFALLSKFDGITEKEYKTYKETFVKKFQLTKLPPYLIIVVKRFTKNIFFVEKNPTVVNFPVKDVDMAEYLAPECLKDNPDTSYDLIANICYEGQTEAEGKISKNYRVHVFHKGASQWYELQDLHVKEILPQMITLSDSYIQIYELQKS
ncbi:U4/U6.U5 tri-snRNP-associated protein 2-like [Dendronephthya gigantea]|uniref:U4/U6.U5 tri-snRNP-associated protein 2-like n=1 Tax=Dendronephthya gigantea TaxID=151771 RepID=UPI00106D3F97|nr:U4/U6.U5 tri-snRNP-associated protein 2-like [Dendronephthya gigantea]